MSSPSSYATSIVHLMPDNDALEAAVQTLRLTQATTPARWSEDTADELLMLVHLTFHEHVVAVLADPVPAGKPTDGGPPLAVRAALHGRAIADLLTALAVGYWRETSSELSEIGMAETPPILTERWINEIVAATTEDNRPTHKTAIDYVRGTAATLSLVARILGAQRGLSLDPTDPRGPVEPPDSALTGDDAGAMLIWCGAAALCIAATLQPDMRIRSSN
jgi:hypothetical protein